MVIRVAFASMQQSSMMQLNGRNFSSDNGATSLFFLNYFCLCFFFNSCWVLVGLCLPDVGYHASNIRVLYNDTNWRSLMQSPLVSSSAFHIVNVKYSYFSRKQREKIKITPSFFHQHS